jgi:hypothetical protein
VRTEADPVFEILCSIEYRITDRVAQSVEALRSSRKVAGLSPDEADFFDLPNPTSRTMAVGSTQPLTEMSTRNLPGRQRAAFA